MARHFQRLQAFENGAFQESRLLEGELIKSKDGFDQRRLSPNGVTHMWEQFTQPIMTYLDPIGVLLGLIIAIPVFWTWYEVTLGRRYRRRRWFREIRRRPGERPAILILDLLVGRDIRPSVERYRQTQPALATVPQERVFRLMRNKKLTAEDLPTLHHELRQISALLQENGTDTLHYFHAGPACVAALVGAEFANTCRLMLYQHVTDPGSYENFGPLKPV